MTRKRKQRIEEPTPDFSVTRIEKPCWRTADGLEFTDEAKAREHTLRQRLNWVLRDEEMNIEGCCYSTGDIVDVVVRRWDEIAAVMSERTLARMQEKLGDKSNG